MLHNCFDFIGFCESENMILLGLQGEKTVTQMSASSKLRNNSNKSRNYGLNYSTVVWKRHKSSFTDEQARENNRKGELKRLIFKF